MDRDTRQSNGTGAAAAAAYNSDEFEACNYYALLNVSPLASFEEIKEGYRKQALRFHPDKNRNVNSTGIFQRVGQAWEVLRDEGRRKEYDELFSRLRRDEIDREVQRQWEASRRKRSSEEEIERVRRAKEWRGVVRNGYLERLGAWKEFRERQLVAIRHYDVLVRRYEKQFEDQIKESEETMVGRFTAAISVSESKGQQFGNHEEVVSRLMEARRVYLLNLKLAGQASRGRLQYLVAELVDGRKAYEDEEFRMRQSQARQALEILKARDSDTPIFSVIDRRRQSINYWQGLLRVRKASNSFTLLEMSEGPWHEAGEWVRVPGEFACGRCARSAFHVIPGCGAAQCPRCATMVCNSCHRDLELLREFEAWMISVDDLDTSLLSLEFEEGSGPIATWDGAGVGRCWV